MNAQSQRCAAAVLEVFGVFLAGGLLTDLLVRLSGVPVTNPLASLNAHMTGVELIAASRQMFVLLLLEYSGYFLLIIPINWWHRRRGAADYGLTKAGHSWTALLLAGLGTAALSEWLVVGISFANSLHPSQTAPWRRAFVDMSWRRWEFWLFSAVMSWALVPVVEELFYRGYCQRRLAEDWGDGPAIVGAACLFTFSHTQYQIPNLYNAGMIAGLLLSAIGFGIVFAWTRSLIPAMVAHAIFDIPMTPAWTGALAAAMIIGAIFIWRRGLAIGRKVFSIGELARTTEPGAADDGRSAVRAGPVRGGGAACATLGALGGGYAILVTRVSWMEYVAVGLIAIAVLLEAVERRKSRTEARVPVQATTGTPT